MIGPHSHLHPFSCYQPHSHWATILPDNGGLPLVLSGKEFYAPILTGNDWGSQIIFKGNESLAPIFTGIGGAQPVCSSTATSLPILKGNGGITTCSLWK
jgi:hypothetical protein